jgi:hypothetical protein
MLMQGYCVRRQKSIFVSRSGKEDCYISKKGNWGAKEVDRNRYYIIIILACENNELLRNDAPMPDFLNKTILYEHGFIDSYK